MVYIATGRSVSDAYQYYKTLQLKTDMICHNGGLIYNPHSDTVKYQNNIYNAKKILEFLITYQKKFRINNIVISRCSETYLLTNKNKYLHQIIINQELPFFYVGYELTKISDIQRIIISVSPRLRQILHNQIVKLFSNIMVCGWRGRDDIIDISVGAVNKWTAVRHIAKENDIPIKNIISFGDAHNDIELLRNSGIGVCMINGVKDAKDWADYITDYDNNENGVYHFLTNYLSKTLNIDDDLCV